MAMKMNGHTEGRVRENTSPNTQRIDFGLRAVKTYDNTKSHARHEENSMEATDSDTEGYNQEGTSTSSRQTPV